VVIATTPLPCSITLVITFQMFYIADLLMHYTIDIVGYPLAVLLTVPIAVVGYYFVAMVLAIVIPLWIVYHTTLYTHSRVKRLLYLYGPYRHDRHNVILCENVDRTKMNKFQKILFLLLLLAYLPSTSAPSPSPSISTNTTGAIVTTVATAVAMSPCMSLSSRGRKRTLSKKKRDMLEEEEEKKRDTQKEKKQRKTTTNVDLSAPGAFAHANSCCNNERCNDGCSNDSDLLSPTPSTRLKPRPNKTSTYWETTKKKRDIQEEEEKKELKKAKRREQYAKKVKDPQVRKARNEKERKRYADMSGEKKEELLSKKREEYVSMGDEKKKARISQISETKAKTDGKIGSALDQDINEVEPFLLGPMNCKCYHCNALGHWCENKGSKTKPHFGALCCNQGKVTIPLARDFELDNYIKKLLTSDTDKEAIYFRKHSVSHFVVLLFILVLLLIYC